MYNIVMLRSMRELSMWNVKDIWLICNIKGVLTKKGIIINSAKSPLQSSSIFCGHCEELGLTRGSNG